MTVFGRHSGFGTYEMVELSSYREYPSILLVFDNDFRPILAKGYSINPEEIYSLGFKEQDDSGEDRYNLYLPMMGYDRVAERSRDPYNSTYYVRWEKRGEKRMKTIEELLEQQPVFSEDFTSKEDVELEFDISLKDIHIVYAVYEQHHFEGHAFVLYIKDGKLYESHGSHCSCYGLEDQWGEEEVTLEALEYRMDKGELNKCVGLAYALGIQV